MTHKHIIDYISHNYTLLSGPARVTLAVASRLLPFDKPCDIIANSQLEQDCHLSHHGLSYAVRSAIRQGLIYRDYACGHCGAGLADEWGHITIGRCPICNGRLHKNVLQRFKLSTRGQKWSSQMLSCTYLDPDTVVSPLAAEYAKRAARLLGRPSDWLKLACWVDREHPEMRNIEIAIAVAYREYIAHSKSSIVSVLGIVQYWYRYVIDTQEHPPTPEYISPRQEQHTLSQLTSILHDLPRASEEQHAWAVGYVWQMYQEMPQYAQEMDKLTLVAGYEPMSLRRYDPVGDMVQAVEVWRSA